MKTNVIPPDVCSDMIMKVMHQQVEHPSYRIGQGLFNLLEPHLARIAMRLEDHYKWYNSHDTEFAVSYFYNNFSSGWWSIEDRISSMLTQHIREILRVGNEHGVRIKRITCDKTFKSKENPNNYVSIMNIDGMKLEVLSFDVLFSEKNIEFINVMVVGSMKDLLNSRH